jgi:hypothetical protein
MKRKGLGFLQMPAIEHIDNVQPKQTAPVKRVKEKLVYTGKLNLRVNSNGTVECLDQLPD